MDELDDASLKFGGPKIGIFFFNSIDEVDAEIEVDGFIAEDILELLANAGHFVLSVEGQDHHKAAIEEDSFHDDVVADEVFEEFLRSLCCFGGKVEL